MSEILTYTKKMFDPLNPNPELIDIRDIAHALSQLCRANGHYGEFYSVCQHSLDCCAEAAARGENVRIQLACLLHDASEAYLSDVTRPVKAMMPLYLEMEAPLQEAVWNQYLIQPLTDEERRIVFEIDDCMLYYEFLSHTGYAVAEIPPRMTGQHSFTFVPFKEAEQAFLDTFYHLSK